MYNKSDITSAVRVVFVIGLIVRLGKAILYATVAREIAK